jgi:hypothetical protein
VDQVVAAILSAKCLRRRRKELVRDAKKSVMTISLKSSREEKAGSCSS